MAKKEFEILDMKGADRSPLARYEILIAGFEGYPRMYDSAGKIEDNCGRLAVYRDRETTASVAIECDGNQDHTLVRIVLDTKIDKTFERIRTVIPNIFLYKPTRKKKR